MFELSTIAGLLPISQKALYAYWPFVATLIGNGYFFVVTTTLVTLFLVGLCLIVKYAPNFLNDLKTKTNNELPSMGLISWIVLVLAFPIFFDAGPLWFVLWWFIVLWGYLNVFEKRMAFVFISIIFMSSWLAHVGAGFLTYAETHVNREIFTVDHSIASAKDTVAIADWVQNNPADAEPMNIQAITEIRKGNYSAAVALLNKGLDLEPNNSRYYNHLGISLASTGRNSEAIKAFQNAVALKPNNIIYHYNLSRLYQATFNFYEAERSVQKASSIDPEMVRNLLDQEEKAKVKKKSYIIEHVPLMNQLARQMKPSGDLNRTADALWDFAFGIFERGMAIYISVAVVLIIFFIGHIPEEKFTKRCHRCGNLYYSGTTSKSGYPMCLQCHWIETKPKNKMNTILANKAEEIKSHRTMNASHTSKLEFILPGLGSFIANRPLKAVVRLTLFCSSLILIITGFRFICSFVPAGVDFTGYARTAGILMAGFLYWRSYKSPPAKYGV